MSSDTDEARPLLSGAEPGKTHGTIEQAEDEGPRSQGGSTIDADEDGAGPGGSPVIEEEQTTGQLLKVMSTVWLGCFLAALDSTLVATLSGPISTQFESLSLLSWLASGYFIANAALQPLAGKLTDIFGRRAGLIFSNVFFAAGNLICGLAGDESTMILGRVVAGMGGGGLTAISTFIASDLIPLRRRSVWQGVGNIMFGIGAGVGSVFGGAINDSIGWRWAFLIQVPATVLSTIIVIFTVKIPVRDTGENRLRRIDFLGATLLVTTLVLMLLGLNSGGNLVPWRHPLVYTTLALSAVSLAIYIYVEARVAREPVIPVILLTRRTTLAACLTNWFLTMSTFGLLFYVPIYFQARGYSATQAGERLVANSVGVAMGSIGVGLLIRRLGRYWWINVGVQATELAGLALICTLDRNTPDVPPFFYVLIVGMGYSGMLTVTLIGLISAVDHAHQAVITSASYAFRSTGSTIGIAIASAVFQNVLMARLNLKLGDMPGADRLIPRIRDSLDEIGRLPADWRDVAVDCYMDAARAVFLTLFALAALGAGCSLLMRENKLHSTISRRD